VDVNIQLSQYYKYNNNGVYYLSMAYKKQQQKHFFLQSWNIVTFPAVNYIKYPLRVARPRRKHLLMNNPITSSVTLSKTCEESDSESVSFSEYILSQNWRIATDPLRSLAKREKDYTAC
jgi:hypothetical protein